MIASLLALMVTWEVARGLEVPLTHFRSLEGCEEDWLLPSNETASQSMTELECAAECSLEPSCLGYSSCPLNRDDTSIRDCRRLQESAFGDCSVLDHQEGCHYKEKACGHGYRNSSTLKCQCLPGYAGDSCNRLLRDCAEGHEMGMEGSFVNQQVKPFGSSRPFSVTCNFDWNFSILLRRNWSCPGSQDFFARTWEEMKWGFGDCSCNCFIGMENMYHLLRQRDYTIRAVFNNASDNQLEFDHAKLGNESTNYQLSSTLANYGFFFINLPTNANYKFCTPDRDCSGIAAQRGHSGLFSILSYPFHGVMNFPGFHKTPSFANLTFSSITLQATL